MAAEPTKEMEAFLASIAALTIEGATKLYVQTREASATATRAYEDQKAQFRLIMERCEGLLLGKATEQGTTGFKTESGTSFVAESVRISVADQSAFTTFLDNLPPDADRYGFFEQRISSRRIEEYTKEHESPPPGLNIFRERVIRVRKASEK